MAIICGPVVRHCTRQEINIWFVTNQKPATLELKVLAGANATHNLLATQSVKSVKVGSSCFIHLLSGQCGTNTTLPEMVYYDVLEDGQGFQQTGLNSSICFKNQTLPSVALPIQHSNILQASCRKPHDPEAIDQMGAASALLQKNLDAANRPSQLFLTGDQIYADDVSPVLLEALQRWCQQLGIAKETLTSTAGKIKDLEQDIPLDGRDAYLTKKSGFTSTASGSHLIGLADYITMYLFSFGGSTLPEFADYKQLKPRLADKPKTQKQVRPGKKVTSAAYKKQLESLTHFRQTCVESATSTKRLLANISTYMIFDDHEVTDDWNLTAQNAKGLVESPLGQQVHTNALSAYYLFQHWGNTPGTVTQADLTRLQKLAQSPDEENRKPLHPLWTRNWGYSLQQTPPVIVLDTRTGRTRSGSKLALMSPQRMQWLSGEVAKIATTPTVIVVSPTPVYGFTTLEALQLKFKDLATAFDREPWIANQSAFKQLQSILLGINGVKDIMIFSGDVHYAFMRRQLFADQGVTFWQFCSSASCNTPTGGHLTIKALEKLSKRFNKKHTRYLQPISSKHFLTSHKNIGQLILQADQSPKEAILLCADPDKKQYSKRYNLKQPKELKA